MSSDHQPLPDDCPPNPNPRRWRLQWWCWWRATAPLFITIVPIVVAGCSLFLVSIFLIIHATALPNIQVDSASSLSYYMSHKVNSTTIFHGDFLFRIKNSSPFVSVKHMHVHVKLNLYYNNHQSLLFTNIMPINSFIVGRLKKVSFTSSMTSTSLEMPSLKSSVTVGVKIKAKRRLGIIGNWWIFAFTLYASCDDMVFTKSPDGWKWTSLDKNECSIDSLFDYA